MRTCDVRLMRRLIFSLSLFTCELWYDIVQLQRCRWVTCIVCVWLTGGAMLWLTVTSRHHGVCRLPLQPFGHSFLHKEHQTWWISWSGQESVGAPSVDRQTENTNEQKVKVRNWTTKESWAKLVPLTGTQQTGSAHEKETGLSRAAGDWTTSCRCAATSAGIGGRWRNRGENVKKKLALSGRVLCFKVYLNNMMFAITPS